MEWLDKKQKGEDRQQNMASHRTKEYVDMIMESMMVDWTLMMATSGSILALRDTSQGTKLGFVEFQGI